MMRSEEWTLGDARVLFTLDSNACYWKIPVAEVDTQVTEFTCPSGTWQCVCPPIRLSNAPATVRTAMNMILASLKWPIRLVYLDDVIVFSCSPKEHLQHLDEVLTRLSNAGVTWKAAKCHFFEEGVKYLGHVVIPVRVHVLEKKHWALTGLRYPVTQIWITRSLGLCDMYRRFVADLLR